MDSVNSNNAGYFETPLLLAIIEFHIEIIKTLNAMSISVDNVTSCKSRKDSLSLAG